MQSADGLCCLAYDGTDIDGDAVPLYGDLPSGTPVAVDECGVCGGRNACPAAFKLVIDSAMLGGAICSNVSSAWSTTDEGFRYRWDLPGATDYARRLKLSGATQPIIKAISTASGVAAKHITITEARCLDASPVAGSSGLRYRVMAGFKVAAEAHASTAPLLHAASTLSGVTGEPDGAIPLNTLQLLPGAGPGSDVTAALPVTMDAASIVAFEGLSSGYRHGTCGNGVCEIGETCEGAACTNPGACRADCTRGGLLTCTPAEAAFGYFPCGGVSHGACDMGDGVCVCGPNHFTDGSLCRPRVA